MLTASVDIHPAGIVHRDVKPENILLAKPTSEGAHMKLCDFGVARPLMRTPETGNLLTLPSRSAYMISLFYQRVEVCPPYLGRFGSCQVYYDGTANDMRRTSFLLFYAYLGARLIFAIWQCASSLGLWISFGADE